MTVHIAIAQAQQAVLLSDSQGSTKDSESHGLHKQFVGANFLVGMAGDGGIIMRQFADLTSKFGYDDPHPVTNIKAAIEAFIDCEVHPSAFAQCVTLVVGCETDGSTSVYEYEPGKFRHFGPRQSFGTIGSGSLFVDRASRRNQELGIVFPGDQLEDLLFEALHYADAANESLTVDDALATAMIRNGCTYLTGDRSLNVRHAPPEVAQFWNQLSPCWDEIRETIRTVNGDLRVAQRTFSSSQRGELSKTDLATLVNLNQGIGTSRKKLSVELTNFLAEYDRIKLGNMSYP